jgi:aspartate dehydrogenase
MLNKRRKKIGIIGCGAIGREVALFVDQQLKDYVFVSALCDIEREKAEELRDKLCTKPKITNIDDLVKRVDLVIECAHPNCVKEVLKKVIDFKKEVVILSVGGLVKEERLLEEARKKNINIYLPSGAICGVDGIGALSLTNIKKITLVTSKPPLGFLGVDYLKKKRINLKRIKKEKVIFRGKIKEAIKYFPQNINVSATLFFASHFKNIEVIIKVNPYLVRNLHQIEVKTDKGNLKIEIENIPSKINPKTSVLTILSVQNLLKKMFSPFKIGS